MIGIRVDGNSHVASGHVMRCISIAKALKEKNQDCLFIVSDTESLDLIEGNGFQVVQVKGKWNDLEVELDALTQVINQYSIKEILVDSYYATNHYLKRLKQMVKVIFIDDLEEEIYEADVIVNYSISCDQVAYTAKYTQRDTKLLLGPKYTPLRNEFKYLKSTLKENVHDILITSGGSDPYDMILKLIKEILEDNRLKNCNLHVVVGKFYNSMEELELLRKVHDNIIVYKNISNMAEVMAKVDLAISAGGTTLLELCCVRVPTVSFAFADNQLNGIHAYAKLGLIETGGDIRCEEDKVIKDIISKIKVLTTDYLKRTIIREKMAKVTDGQGAMHIAEEIIALSRA